MVSERSDEIDSHASPEAGDQEEEFAAFQPGKQVAGKYRIEKRVGTGAMGIVVAARHLELDDVVALKFIRPDVATVRDVVHRFAREAKASARIKSEHVARVIDVGVESELGPFIVMEYLEGRDLGEVIADDGAVSSRRACEYVMQACEALAIAHSLGITHRDIKPANLFLTRSGGLDVIKVLDFGISKAALTGHVFGDDLSVVQTTYMLGTPLYMSPEQIRGSGAVDHRTDVWSLGVTLRELLSGRPTFSGNTMTQVCARVLESEPASLRSEGSVVPDGLQEVIDRCLKKRPAERFANVAELAAALIPFASSRSTLHAERASSVLSRSSQGTAKPPAGAAPRARASSPPALELGSAPPKRLAIAGGAFFGALLIGGIALWGASDEPRQEDGRGALRDAARSTGANPEAGSAEERPRSPQADRRAHSDGAHSDGAHSDTKQGGDAMRRAALDPKAQAGSEADREQALTGEPSAPGGAGREATPPRQQKQRTNRRVLRPAADGDRAGSPAGGDEASPPSLSDDEARAVSDQSKEVTPSAPAASAPAPVPPPSTKRASVRLLETKQRVRLLD